jgi:hypothetical protein
MSNMQTQPIFDFSLPPLIVDDRWDVIVFGGGPSGCTAAAASAREGAKTLLVESTGALGGSGTNALVPAWCPFTDHQKIIYRGLALTIFNLARHGMSHVSEEWLDWTPIDSERLKVVYDDIVTGSGASLLFHTMLSAVANVKDQSVQEVIITNKSGLSALKAKVYVDCTGDADLAAWAGAEFRKGDSTGTIMPATHCFVLSNVDDTAFHIQYNDGTALERSNPDSAVYKIIASGRYPLITDAHFCCTKVGPGTVGVNAGHIWDVDNTLPESVTAAQIQGRKIAVQYRDALAEFCPEAFGNAFLAATGNVVGARESRRIKGDYVLTLADYIARRHFDDEICLNSYFLDVHQSVEDITKANAVSDNISTSSLYYGAGESHGIPYRCLTPKGLRNVLVAGRSISCERSVQGSVRVMPACLVMGEAAGLAAAIAASSSGDVHNMDTDYLRQRLREEGAFL